MVRGALRYLVAMKSWKRHGLSGWIGKSNNIVTFRLWLEVPIAAIPTV